MENIHLSIVSPVYRAEKVVETLVERIEKSISDISSNYEIILVEDGGPDNSWNEIRKIAKKNPKVKAIKLSRNFGQHYAITAGLDYAKGEWVVVMDCDLQDQPEEIPKLYKKALEGYDVVLARRFQRKDSFYKRVSSALFYRTLGYLTASDFDETVANFGVYNKKVVSAFCTMKESIRVFPIMVKWLGYNTVHVNVEHAKRLEGKSSYNFRRLMNLALDIILAYSDKPLRIITKFGFILSISSFLFAGITILRYFTGQIKVDGYTSLIFSIWFLSGIIILTLGIIGLYVGKIFDGVKGRPIYAIDTIIN